MVAFTKKPQSVALAFLVAGSFWFMVGTTYGLFSAIHLVAPEFFNNIPWLVFGRTRPIHVNTVLFGFVGTTLIGCGLYYMPALLRTRLWSEPLGWVSFALWNAAVLSGPLTFSFGHSQGREYTEYLWPFDVLIMLALVLLLFNLLMTLSNRSEKTLYVSVWYFLAMFFWTSGFYPIGNVMWHPSTGAASGFIDSIFLWAYGHNLPGLFLTPLAVGAAYYVIPRLTKTPLYSHTMSLLGFWLLVAFYSHIGGHHLLQSPIPGWLKAISVIDSVAMGLPVLVVLLNLWLTMRGNSAKIWRSPSGLFVMGGTIWYLLTCIQGPAQSLPQLQRVTHFNNWTVGHAHIAVVGFAGFIAIGTLWHVVPLITKRRLYSSRLVFFQFGLITTGLIGFFVVLTTAGLIQGHGWYNGETVYRMLPEIAVYMGLRALFGVFIVTSAFVGFYNLIMTVKVGEPFDPSAVEEEQYA